jgi:hypothetical protein
MSDSYFENQLDDNIMDIISQISNTEHCSLTESISRYINNGINRRYWNGNVYSDTRYATLFVFNNFLKYLYELEEIDNNFRYYTHSDLRYLSQQNGMKFIELLISENSDYFFERFGESHQVIYQNFELWLRGQLTFNNIQNEN